MRHISFLLAVCLSLSACGAPVMNEFGRNPDLAGHTTTATLDSQVIVKYKTAASFKTKGTELLYRMPGSVVLDSFQGSEGLTELQRIPAGVQVSNAVKGYEADSTVEAAAPNETWTTNVAAPTPNDPRYGEMWHAQKLRYTDCWSKSQGEGTIVAVIDTGIDANHPDLVGQIAPGGYDFVSKDNDPRDGNGHGTHVAGIIAAAGNNGTGIVGIAPKAKILPLRVLNDAGQGSTFIIMKAMNYAATKGAKIINLSLGGPPGGILGRTYFRLYGDALLKKGILLIAASGNEGGAVGMPAQVASFMAVGATNDLDKTASFSNFGKQVSVSAPGVNILSTMPTYPCYLSTNHPGTITTDYSNLSGTSMATPLVAGAAALLLSQNPTWTPAQLRDKLEKSALDLGPAGRDVNYGFGRIRPWVALGLAI
ncbi:MAG: S8 family serine peptidase [Candidatus Sericytochromatia bacterium]|nr:S8 family serine peptidase [Candidatus Sericytochromatia bacterium]